jgi:CSLREA domain-containing protein
MSRTCRAEFSGRLWLSALAVTLLVAAEAEAAFRVNSVEDAPDVAPGDGVCATAVGTCTLRAAVMEANAHVGTDHIILPAGVYNLTTPVGPYDSAEFGDLDVWASLDIRGAGPDVTVIDGGRHDRVFDIGDYPKAVRFRLRGVTVRNGYAPASLGGGIEVYFADARLTDCVVTGNEALLGGGIDVLAGRLTLSDTTVSDNVGTGCCGGIRLLFAGTSANLRHCTVRGNRATGVTTGGGITAFRGITSLRISNSVIEDNTAGMNGAGLLFAGTRGKVVRSIIRNNRADGSGGGVSTFLRDPPEKAAGLLTLVDTTITGNVADADGDGTGAGGGISADDEAPAPILRRTSVTGNADQSGRAPDCAGPVTNGGQSAIGDVTGCLIQ